MTIRSNIGLLGALALTGLLGTLAPAAPGKQSGGASFTAAQAASGAKLYAKNCGQCHGAKLEGLAAPALKGEAMHGSQTVADLYAFIATSMPGGSPGSLSATTYAAIMAFLLKENGHRAGSVALTPANVKKMTAKI